MSNPAVTQLVHGTINEGVFQVNDSLGEAIQIFLADHQLDLTTEGLRALSEELKDTLNDLINLVSCYDDGKNYVGLLVEKANVCSNLHYRIAIVDCIHAHFQDSPVTLNMDELNKWWEKTHKPEYERGCKALKIHEENVLK